MNKKTPHAAIIKPDLERNGVALIGGHLKSLYDGALGTPLPQSFMVLLERLANSKRRGVLKNSCGGGLFAAPHAIDMVVKSCFGLCADRFATAKDRSKPVLNRHNSEMPEPGAVDKKAAAELYAGV